LRLTVVKVGGSFASYRRLGDVVQALERGRGHAVVVPGGGPFADVVRREQPRLGFDDSAAHRMALLGMAQFGIALASLSPRLKTATRISAIRRGLRENVVPVWLPLDLLDRREDVPESWEMTSDSLAAWLAGKIRASRVIFLKRASPASMKLLDLVEAGDLDSLVPGFLTNGKAEAWLCTPRDLTRIGKALATGTEIGRRIKLD
jgi:5-(aminomethyl)-3-furanmethanol phosphate kinase